MNGKNVKILKLLRNKICFDSISYEDFLQTLSSMHSGHSVSVFLFRIHDFIIFSITIAHHETSKFIDIYEFQILAALWIVHVLRYMNVVKLEVDI
jgi:hypothetical protein